MIGMFDKNGKGSISFDEFGALWKYVVDWQNCFRSFDQDNSGMYDSTWDSFVSVKDYHYNTKFKMVVFRCHRQDGI